MTNKKQLMKIIKAKAKGKPVTYKPMKMVHSKTTDWMKQLKASLANKKKKNA
jgi:DNA end-binding protein Ku